MAIERAVKAGEAAVKSSKHVSKTDGAQGHSAGTPRAKRRATAET